MVDESPGTRQSGATPATTPVPATPVPASGAKGARPRRLWRWRGWVLALGALAWGALSVYAVAESRPRVEADLTRRASAALAAPGEGWASVGLSARDATLRGEALTEESRARARARVAETFGVRTVQDATTLLPERHPFTFSAVKDGRAIALDGYVPSDAALEQIVAAARATGAQVGGRERVRRARGAPPGDFAAQVAFGLRQLDRLPSGRIILSDGAIAIEGRAPDLATYESLSTLMRAPLPEGMSLARFAVRPPVAAPFSWSASRDGNTLRLSGYVPSEEARAQVLAALKEALPGATVKDDTHLADGAPSTDLWLKAVRFAGTQLAALPGGQASLSDSAIAMDGDAPTFAVFDALNAARKAPPEGFQVTRFSVTPPRASPFVWKLERTAGAVRITGNAPSEEARRVLADAVRATFPGVAVGDDMRLASGGPAPDLWTAASSLAVAQLAKLRHGAATISAGEVRLEGEAADSAGYASILQAAKSPPDGIKVDTGAVKPPVVSPFVFAVRRDGQGLTVSGFYPDEAAHGALRAALDRDFLKETVNDVSVIGSGAPAGFLDAVLAGLQQLARIAAGELSITDNVVRLTGTALHPAAREEIVAGLRRALKPPFEVETDLKAIAPAPTPAVPPDECQAQLSDLMGRGTILFNTGSSVINRTSRGLLDRLAETLRRCPSAVVEVAGHTDSVGGEAENQHLSEQRARAVVDDLAGAGIDRARLFATGYGAARPVAGNDSEAGRTQNRRIELVVREGRAP